MISKIKENQITVSYESGESGIKLPYFLVQSEFAFLVNIVRKATKVDIDFEWIKVTLENINTISFSKSDLNEPFISYNKSM